jgi:hypothetical protein
MFCKKKLKIEKLTAIAIRTHQYEQWNHQPPHLPMWTTFTYHFGKKQKTKRKE